MTKKDTAYTTKLKNINPLNILFGEDDDDTTTVDSRGKPSNTINTIPIAVIQLLSTQPRKYFDPKKLEELSLSIKELGILEPLIVRPVSDEYYELIAGERRLKAATMAGLEEVPVVVKEMDDNLVKQVQLIENLQREDLNAYEETVGILELLALRLGKSPEEVISLLNWIDKVNRRQTDNVIRQLEEQNINQPDTGSADAKSEQSHPHSTSADNVIRQSEREVVESVFASLGRLSAESFRANRLPLLNLPQDIQDALRRGAIEYTKARAIAKVKNVEARTLLLQTAIEENLSLTEIQYRIQGITQQKKLDARPSLKTQYKELSQQLAASKIWNNPRKKKALEKLLNQIKTLLDSDLRND